MPCTFSHPIAIVPLHRVSRGRLNLPALVLGAMVPDLGYYIRQFEFATFAHTVPGSIIVCVPCGLGLLVLFYLLREPISFMLPQPHREALLPLARQRPDRSIQAMAVAAISILLGAWTHTIWDSFTHEHGWMVRQIPSLQASLVEIRGTLLPLSYLLQQASTVAGGLGLAILYVRWLRSQPRPGPNDEVFSDRTRYLLLAGIGIAALCIAIPGAIQLSRHYQGYLALRVFLFRSAIYTSTAFLSLLALVALGARFMARPRPRN